MFLLISVNAPPPVALPCILNMHWHRGLGAVAYCMVTLHMLLWWLKWILDGTFKQNLLAVDTQAWMWITPSWSHYENWSVMMVQRILIPATDLKRKISF